jgi:hypothetical protein
MKRLKIMLKSSNTFKTHSESRKLFKLWRSYDLASSVFSFLGLVIATLNYELSFSPSRDFNNCQISSLKSSDVLKMIIAFATFVSILCLGQRYLYKIRWKRKVYYKGKDKDYKKTKIKNFFFFIGEVGMLCVFPYPNVEKKVFVPIRFNFETFLTCYNLSEILYSFMFVRVLLILRALINYSSFQNSKARALCRDYKVKANLRFLVKCLLMKHPMFFIFGMAVLWLFVFALTFRIFERPVDDLSNFLYENPMTAIWFMVENMTTLGYGDFYPVTYPSRIISVLSYLIGAVIFSFMIVSLQKNVDLDIHQVKVFKYVVKIPFAINVIKKSLEYFISKKKLGPNHQQSLKLFESLLKIIKKFKKIRIDYQTKENRSLHDLKKSVKVIANQVKSIDKVVSSAIEEVLSKKRLKMTF